MIRVEPLTSIHSIMVNLVCSSPGLKWRSDVRYLRFSSPGNQRGVVRERSWIWHVEQHSRRQDNSFTTDQGLSSAQRRQDRRQPGNVVGECCADRVLVF